MAKKQKGMSNLKSQVSRVVKEAEEKMSPAERLGHAWKSALASGGKLDKTNAAFPMGKGSQGVELFREMMVERGRTAQGAEFNELWNEYTTAPYDFEF